jgi:hypothetical protein
VIRQGQRGHDVPLVRVKVAPAADDGVAEDVAAAILGDVGSGVGHQAPEVALRDEVDHTADRVGAIDGRGAVLEDLDALDGREGNGVEVDHASVEAVRGDAAAIEQDKGGIGALAAEVGRGGAVVAARGTGHHVGLRREVVKAVAVDVEVHDQLLGARDALLLHVELGEHRERQRAFVGDALDHRAGDDELLKFDGFVRLGVGGSSGGGLRQCGGNHAHGGNNREPDRPVP